MNSAESSLKMRTLTISALVLDGIAAAGFITLTALENGRMTPLDGFVLCALLLGFFSALGSILITSPEPRPVLIHMAGIPERRRVDRRMIDLGSPTGIERRNGHDRRVVDITLGGVLTARSGYPEYRFRS